MSRPGVLGILVGTALVAAAGTGAWWLSRQGSAPAAEERGRHYHCPMHPTLLADSPGDCPICHMSLVPLEHEDVAVPGAPGSQGDANEKSGIEQYHCPMHPTLVADQPGDCPICHMRLVSLEQEAVAPAPARGPAVPGLAPVRLSMRKQQLIGVKTAPVVREPLARAIRAVGRVTYDETRLHHVHTKVAGWVEKLHANATGGVVRAGQPLLEIYSPELLASQQEYLIALRARERAAASTLPSAAGLGQELLSAARRRLELYDLTEEQILELERTGVARRTTTLQAPISGTIIERMATQGQRIGADTNLLDIADLSRVWVLASIYEHELPLVHEGQRATMRLAYVPGTSFEGLVTLVYPVLEAATRTASVRLSFANPALTLKPGMYADVELDVELGQRLVVPETAVTETGVRSVVFVDQGDGLFEPREVQIGLRVPERYEILAGLVEGERVLTSANFFVDSESKLKSALAAMQQAPVAPAAAGSGDEAAGPPATPHRH